MIAAPGSEPIRVKADAGLGEFRLAVDLSVPSRGITAIFGPSGAGKSTLLDVVSGLARFDGAEVFVAGETWQAEDVFLPTHRRAVGHVFQDARLFPHLDVMGNLLFGFRRAPEPRHVSVERAVDLMGLAALVHRKVGDLSGGERQRVAIARALLSQPDVILMDEPLSALDQQSRREILPRLRAVQAELGAPILYVTHDMAEVERLADWLVLLDQGRVTASGPLAQLQADVTLPLARRRESVVTLDARLAGRDEDFGLSCLEVDGGALWLPDAGPVKDDIRRIQIGASDVSLTLNKPTQTTILNVLPARITQVTAADPLQMVVSLALGDEGQGATILARVTRKSVVLLGLSPGLLVHAQVKGAALVND